MEATSYWLASGPTIGRTGGQASASFDPLDELHRIEGVDVLVVGAGMAGLCTAALLHERGAEVAVVDAGPIASRTTGHTTAKITALHGTIYSSLRRGRVAEVAARYAVANRAAVRDLVDLVERWDLECELTTATAFTCAASPDGVPRIEAEAEAAAAAGLPVRLAADTELPIEVFAAVALDGEAHFHPVKFAAELAARLRRDGVPVLEGVRVTDIEEDAGGRCTVHLENRRPVSVARAVQTTHLPVTDPAFLAARVRPMRSYVVAGEAPTIPAGMYLAADDGWSIRPTGGRSPVCLVGGEGHPMADDLSSLERYRRLETFARESLGAEVSHRWSAFDYEPVDGLPFIGRLSPRSERRYVATGFQKWGMSNGMVAAAILADALDGRAHPQAQVFDATRLARNVGRDLIRNNLHVGVRFVKDRLAATTCRPEVDELEPGQGSVVWRDGTLVARSRDRAGTERAVAATCTHLGCVVGFNDGDQTWDCPCHGSRFALDGTVLDGPATDPLPPVDVAVDAHAVEPDRPA